MRIKRLRYVIYGFVLCLLLQASSLSPVFGSARGQFAVKFGTAEVQKGKSESFFSDWDLCTDNSNNTAVDKTALKEGQSYFHGFMDKHGRIIELRYYDLRWIHKWTKRFYYGSRGRHAFDYVAPNGQRINHKKQEAVIRKRYAYRQGTRKEEIRRSLGDPIIIQMDPFGMEKWRYFDGVGQHWYTFNAKGELDYSNYRQ